MNSLILSLSAAVCSSTSSLIFRKNEDNSSSVSNPSGYLAIFYLSSLVFSLIFYPHIWQSNVNFIILAVGALVGLLSSTLMVLTASAIKIGPSGLTFAFQSASAVFPGLILFLFLGSDFGYSCSYFQCFGMMVVLFGLFLGTKQNSSKYPASASWLKYALICFFLQILALTFIQARCLLFNCHEGTGLFSDFTITEADDVWFMPGQFGASFLMQAVMFLWQKRHFKKSELIYGGLGGIANFGSTILLLLSTKFALPYEKAILFPCFAVGCLIFCNVWANRLYHEKFNFRTNILCSCGIFMAVAG